MKCYCICDANEVGSLSVNDGGLFIMPHEILKDEKTIIENTIKLYKIYSESHWRCNAQSDNGIDADDVKGSVTNDIDIEQLVLNDNDVFGIYLSNYNVVIALNKSISVNEVSEGYVGGWGEIETYDKISVIRGK